MSAPISLPEDLAQRLAEAGRDGQFPTVEGMQFEKEKIIPAAVLMPLFISDGRWHLLYTRRTETLHSHKGQVSFPGGAWEEVDETIVDTALREAWEETGIQQWDVKVQGQLPSMELVSCFMVTPVVGVIPWPYLLKINADEVARAFAVPLDWLAEPRNLVYRERAYQGRLYRVPFFKEYEGETIWGATAMMTLEFLKLLG